MRPFKTAKRIDTEPEKKIAIGMITDDTFISTIAPITDVNYFLLEYLKPIIRWSVKYYESYNKAPGRDIQFIFEEKAKNMEEEFLTSIESFLFKLSDIYETTAFNSAYQIDLAKTYFKERAYRIKIEKATKLLNTGNLNKVDELFRRDVAIETGTSKAYNPFDPIRIRNRYSKDKVDDSIFRFPGALGQLVGGFERNSLIAIQAPEKTGKTWWLQEVAFLALFSGLKVAWFSFEMNSVQTERRIDAMLTGSPMVDRKKIIFPVFDCKHNQKGECFKKQRKNKVNNLLSGLSEKEKPVYGNFPKYEICTACRGTDEFEAAIWYTDQEDVKAITSKIVETKSKWLRYRNNIRIVNYPSYRAGFKEVKNNLAEFALSGFEPDVIVIDYLDIMERDRTLSERDSIFKNWREAKAVTSELNTIMFTADQADAQARGQARLKQTNFTDDKRKDSVLEIKIGLNKTEEEEFLGLTRINVLYNRMNPFITTKEVMITQCLDLGQCMLDNEYWIRDSSHLAQ